MRMSTPKATPRRATVEPQTPIKPMISQSTCSKSKPTEVPTSTTGRDASPTPSETPTEVATDEEIVSTLERTSKATPTLSSNTSDIGAPVDGLAISHVLLSHTPVHRSSGGYFFDPLPRTPTTPTPLSRDLKELALATAEKRKAGSISDGDVFMTQPRKTMLSPALRNSPAL